MCDFIGKILIQIEQNDFSYNCVFALRVLKVSQRKRLFFFKKKKLYLGTYIKELPLIKVDLLLF